MRRTLFHTSMAITLAPGLRRSRGASTVYADRAVDSAGLTRNTTF